ncbi:DnaJ C-terminal domain-containing protein [Asticcacaulis sp.]|uniref:DnaJ C-terminal domain-containing protein n=1 Tax=Asticcacaulis sp. TaxID=1872648 RepID=UPI003918A54F
MNRTSALGLLGLSEPIRAQDVQAAFRQRVKRAHPDLNGTDAPLRRLILARDLLMRQLRNGPDISEIIEELSDPAEPLRLSVETAVTGGGIVTDVPLPLELIHDAGPGRSLMHRKTLRITLPAGLRDGERLRLKAARPGGTEHVFRIEIERRDDLHAEGHDLCLTVPVDARRLRLGGQLRVETPHGLQTVDLSDAVDNRLTLKGLGLPATSRYPAGDLHLRFEAYETPLRPASDLLAEFHRKWA